MFPKSCTFFLSTRLDDADNGEQHTHGLAIGVDFEDAAGEPFKLLYFSFRDHIRVHTRRPIFAPIFLHLFLDLSVAPHCTLLICFSVFCPALSVVIIRATSHSPYAIILSILPIVCVFM